MYHIMKTYLISIKRPEVKLTTHLHLVSRLRIGGAIPPLPQYAFSF
jgi:hypothetical protein